MGRKKCKGGEREGKLGGREKGKGGRKEGWRERDGKKRKMKTILVSR